MPKLTDAAKFLLVLSVPLAALFAGVNIAVLALAEASESIKWLPSSLFHVPNILLALSVVVASIGVVRVLFAFSRYAEVRVGYSKTFPPTDTTLDTRPVRNQLARLAEPPQAITDGRSIDQRDIDHDAATDAAKSNYRRATITRLSVPSLADRDSEMGESNSPARQSVSDRPKSRRRRHGGGEWWST